VSWSTRRRQPRSSLPGRGGAERPSVRESGGWFVGDLRGHAPDTMTPPRLKVSFRENDGTPRPVCLRRQGGVVV
jgi:hypothetical protein